MKKLLLSLFGLAALSLQALGTDQIAESVSELTTMAPIDSPTAVPVTDMYHYTEADEVELQAALNDFTQIQGEYRSLCSQFSVISFKALESDSDGCRVEMDGGVDSYIVGFKALSDRYYSDVAVKKNGDYTYTTVNKSSRTVPSYTVCSSEELEALSKKRIQSAQAQFKYSKLLRNRSTKIANERALNANIESAENGEAYGLQRMAERYRKGDGVEKNLKKAADLLQKAEVAGQSEENSILVANEMKEERAARKTFQLALKSADEGDYVAAADVARYYRDGKGTDKDLDKALAYFEKSLVLKNTAGYSAIPYSLKDEIDEVKKQLKSSDNASP